MHAALSERSFAIQIIQRRRGVNVAHSKPVIDDKNRAGHRVEHGLDPIRERPISELFWGYHSRIRLGKRIQTR